MWCSRAAGHSAVLLTLLLCLFGDTVQSLTYLEEPSNVTASLNEDVIMTCKVEGLVVDQSIVWEKDGLIISIDEFLHANVTKVSSFTVELNRETGEYKLTITNIKLEDSGNYRCGVQVDNGKYWSAKGILTVLRYINHQPNDIAVFEGESVTLSCAAHIDVHVQSLLWAKDSEIFAYNDSFVDVNLATRVTFTGDVTRGEYGITIANVSEQDTGRYRCGVETESGDIEWSRLVWLTVLEFTQIEQRTESVLENETHVLQCRVTEMQPGQDLVWHKDGTLIAVNEYVLYSTDNEDFRVIIEASSSYYNMKFKSAELADSGEYKCGVEFPNGVYFWFSAIKFTVLGEEIVEFPSTTVGTTLSSKYLTSEYSTFMTTTGYGPEQTSSTMSRQQTTTGTVFKTQSMKPTTTMTSSSHRASMSPVEETTRMRQLTTKAPAMLSATAQPGTSESARQSPSEETPATTRKFNFPTAGKDTRAQPATPDIELWVIIVAVIIGLLALIALSIIFIVIVKRTKRKRLQKKSDEYSPQDESLESLRLRLKAAGYENPVLVTDDEQMTEKSSNEDDVEAQSRESGNGKEMVTNIDDLYAQPDKSAKYARPSTDAENSLSTEISGDFNIEENVEDQKPEVPNRNDDILIDVMETDHVQSQDSDALSSQDSGVNGSESDGNLLNESIDRTTL